MLNFIKSIVEFITDIVSSISSAIEYFSSGVENLLNTPAIFPSIFGLLPSGYTGVIVALLAIGLMTALFCTLLKR